MNFDLRKAAVGAIALVAVGAAVGCGSSDSSSADGEGEIAIGAYASSTGALKVFGSFEEEGWKLAEEHINAEGGILGRDVRIEYKDDGSSKDQARSIMQEFVSDDSIIGTAGPTSTANAFASQPLAVSAKLPVVTVSNNAEGVLEQGEYIHRISLPDQRLIPPALEQIVPDLGIEKAAILYAQDDPFSLVGFKAFEAAAKDLGVEVSASVAYSLGTPDLGAQIEKIKSSNPDAVFVAAYAGDAGTFLRQARAAGLDVPVVGNSSFNSPDQLSIAGSAADGLIIPSQWWIGDKGKVNQKFVKAYREQFDRAPANFAAIAYNSLYVIKDALEASEDTSREGLQEGLDSLKGYHVLGAPIQFKDRDAFTDAPIMLMAKDGEFVPYSAKAFE